MHINRIKPVTPEQSRLVAQNMHLVDTFMSSCPNQFDRDDVRQLLSVGLIHAVQQHQPGVGQLQPFARRIFRNIMGRDVLRDQLSIPCGKKDGRVLEARGRMTEREKCIVGDVI